ncbi:MAG TPA: hypothetical protein VK190_03430 [Pseudoneobacillus sp.]|nr:hypothetical protein [Pseudoneobacillus sp.]
MSQRKAGFNPSGAQAGVQIPAGLVPMKLPDGNIVYVPGMGGFMPGMPGVGVPGMGMPEGLPFDVPAAGIQAGNVVPNISFGANIDLKFEDQAEIDPKWYLKREEDLAVVTAERNNPTVGVTDIKIFKPTQNQKNAGIVCKIQLVTPVATFNNISIMGSKFDQTAVRLVSPSHEGTNGNWFEDYKLDQKVVAQVLSYVDSLITK